MQFICIKTCQGADIIKRGQVLNVESIEKINPAIRDCFEEKKQFDKKMKEQSEMPEEELVNVLHMECEELGIPYDGRWGVKKLQHAIAMKKGGKD